MAIRNPSRRLKIRLALVLALAIVAAVAAWRMDGADQQPRCTNDRREERDSSGKVVRIVRTACLG